MEKIKWLYWGFSTVILIEVFNLVFKFFSTYYFNLAILAILTLLVAWLGKHLGIKVVWLVVFSFLTLLLLALLSFVVWN